MSTTTTIPLGLEIRRLGWKDDAFRQADHAPSLPPSGVPTGMLGWWDNTTGNAITFANGTVTTNGAFGAPSPAITNGDELTLPANIEVEKDFPVAIPAASTGSIRLRAKNAGLGDSILSVILLYLEPLPSPHLAFLYAGAVDLTSTLYTHYTIGPTYLGSDVWGVQLICDNGAIIDYVALATCDYINQGGQSLDVSIPKKTVSQTIPNEIDIIQQLGISSRSKAVVIPKITVTAYRWLEDKLTNGIPLELLTPTQQATGYLSDLKRHTEAGWVGVPLPTTDSLLVTATGQQLYDISFTLVKADNEANIETTALACPVPPVPFPPSLSLTGTTYDGDALHDSYARKSFYADGRWWVVWSNGSGSYALHTGTTHNPTSATACYDPYMGAPLNGWVGYTLSYFSGPANGQSKTILSNTATTITTAAFAPAPTPTGGDWYIVFAPIPLGIEEASSSDRNTWTTQIDLDSGLSPTVGYDLAVWYDIPSNTFRYVSLTAGNSPRYRVGTPHANGSIAWLAAEQVLPFGWFAVSVITDTNGYDWVCNSSSGQVFENANTDGTWSTALTHTVPSINNRATIVPLSAGKVAIVYSDTASHNIYAQWYDGAWHSSIGHTFHDVDSSSGGAAGFTAVTIGDIIYIAAVDSVGDVWYVKFDAATNSFSEEQTLVPSVSINARPMVSKDYLGNIFVFYPVPSSNTMNYLRRWVDGSWSSVQVFSPAVGAFPSDERFASSWDDTGGFISVAFLAASGGTPSWNVWTAFLDTH
jgi:hypothetical protein